MNGGDPLRRLGAGPAVRSALAQLPPAFAEAFAAEAARMVEAEAVAVRPVEDADGSALPVPRSIPDETRRLLLMETRVTRGGVASLAVARWRVLDALMCQNAGRLRAAACGFLLVRAAWEEANRRRLVPAGEDWPPLPSREFTSTDNPATPPAEEEEGRRT